MGLVAAGSVRADKPTIQPGKWSITIKIDLEGAPIPPRTVERCVEPEDAKEPVEMIKSSGQRSKSCSTRDVDLFGQARRRLPVVGPILDRD